jgi:hypothetical protein
MIRRLALAFTIVSATVATAFVGCGGSTSKSSSGGGTDAGPGETSVPVEASTGDAAQHKEGSAGEGGDDGGGTLPEGSVAPHGTQIVTSQYAALQGVTSDGYAIYNDISATTLNAVSLAGGAPSTIGDVDAGISGSGGVFVAGDVVVAVDNVDGSTGLGTITTWTSAKGAHTASAAALGNAPGSGALDVSSDGAHLLLIENLQAATFDVAVVDVDGTNHKVLVAGAGYDPNCPASIGFAGAYAVAVYCPPSDAGIADGGTSPATITTFTGTGWTTTATITTTATTGFGADKAGAHILFGSAAGLQVAPLATGTPVTIDATGTTGLFTSDGNHVVYVTSGGNVATAPSAGGTAPTTLITTGGFTGIAALSPDDSHVVIYKTGDTSNGFLQADLYAASAATAGSATTLSSATTNAVFGDLFTADSTHVLFDESLAADFTGNFTTVGVSGGTPSNYGPENWTWNATAGSKAVFNLNYAAGGNQGGTADLMGLDTAGSAAPTLLVTQADAYYYLTAAKDKVVYSWSYLPNSMSGVWVLPAP